jgi:ornithine carbamoyltransferase
VKHFLDLADWTAADLQFLLDAARALKEQHKREGNPPLLAGKALGMIFQKPSLRTRVSFEMAMQHVGGHALYLSPQEIGLGKRESIADIARVLGRYVDAIMARTFEHEHILELARWSPVPVINGLTNEFHPCQILADVYTFLEHRGSIAGRTVAWIGDSNNVLYTWLQAAELLGFTLHVSTPPGYAPDAARVGRAPMQFFADPHDAARGADLVTTDVWTSMGFEAEDAARRKAFARWCVDETVMRAANPDALFMHCLPAHRGEEVTNEVIEGPQSVVWDEAENRLHVQKALMEYLLLGRDVT